MQLNHALRMGSALYKFEAEALSGEPPPGMCAGRNRRRVPPRVAAAVSLTFSGTGLVPQGRIRGRSCLDRIVVHVDDGKSLHLKSGRECMDVRPLQPERAGEVLA